jgi:hypothetical protein
MDAQTYLLTKVTTAAFQDELEKLASFQKLFDRISKWSLRAGEKANKSGVTRREFLRRAGIRAAAPVAGRVGDTATSVAKATGALGAVGIGSGKIGRRSAMKRLALSVGGGAALAKSGLQVSPSMWATAKKAIRTGGVLPKTTFRPVGSAMRAAKQFGAGAVGRSIDKATIRKLYKFKGKRGREFVKAYPEVAIETLMGALG